MEKVLAEILERLEMVERRLSRLERCYEGEGGRVRARKELTPALVKVLAVIKQNSGIGDPKMIADKLDIPRNIASIYLNRLTSMGFLDKKTNPDPRIKARYIYELREEKLDERVKELMEVVENAYKRS